MCFECSCKEPIYCEICGIDITYDYKYQSDEFDYLCEECYFEEFENEVRLYG